MTESSGFSRLINCGKCMPCRINRQSEWSGRILMEMRLHPTSAFVTLTYSDEALANLNLKENMNLSKRQLQLFIKRLRKRLTDKTRYFGVGEYGTITKRPHYHLILFGLHCGHTQIVRDAWPHGFTETSLANPMRARYVAKYTTKVLSGPMLEPFRQPEFALMSRKPGIGLGFLPRVAKAASNLIHVPTHIRIDGKIYRLDTYCQTKLSELMDKPTKSMDKIAAHLVANTTVVIGDPKGRQRRTSEARAQATIRLAKEKERL